MSYERARPTQWGNYGGLSRYWGLAGDGKKGKGKKKGHDRGDDHRDDDRRGEGRGWYNQPRPIYQPQKMPPMWSADPWRRGEDMGRAMPAFSTPMLISSKPTMPTHAAAVMMDSAAQAPQVQTGPAVASMPPAPVSPEPAPESQQAAPINPQAQPAQVPPTQPVLLRPYPMMPMMPGPMMPNSGGPMPPEAQSGGGFTVLAPNKSTLAKIGTALAAGLLLL